MCAGFLIIFWFSLVPCSLLCDQGFRHGADSLAMWIEGRASMARHTSMLSTHFGQWRGTSRVTYMLQHDPHEILTSQKFKASVLCVVVS